MTEQMIREMNGVLKALGEEELALPKEEERRSELELLRRVKSEYLERLRKKIPKYRLIPGGIIPDMFLQALRKRESDLKAETTT